MLHINLDTTASTQLAAKELAALFPDQDIVVQSRLQTSGRGQYDRSWDSKDGGLYISLLLRPSKPLQDIPNLSVKTGEIVSSVLKRLYGIKTKIKLPNDVLAADKGSFKKISGILIESSYTNNKLNWLVIGIGVNINNAVGGSLCATSVKKIIKKQVDIEEFKKELLSDFIGAYSLWQQGCCGFCNLNGN